MLKTFGFFRWIFGIQGDHTFRSTHWWLFGGFWVNTVAQFMFSSVLAVHFHRQHIPPLGIGLLMLLYLVSMRCMGPFCGAILDRFGPRPSLMAGTALASLGYAATAYSHEIWQFSISLCLLGFGLGLDHLCRSTLLVQVSSSKDEGNRSLAFYYVVFNFGAACGPLLSSLATGLAVPMKDILLIVAAISLATGASFAGLFPFPAQQQVDGGKRASFKGLGIAWSDRRFRSLVLALPLIWFLFCLMHVCVPVLLLESGGVPESTVSGLFSLNAVMVVFFGFRINRFLTTRCANRGRSQLDGIAWGAGLMGLGLFVLFAIAWAPTIASGAFMVVFTLGELCFIPMVQVLVNESISRSGGTPGPYFGLATLAWGVGGGASNVLGGYVIGLCKNYGFALFPAIFGTFALLVAVIYLRLSDRWVNADAVHEGNRITLPLVRRPSSSA